jgi:soluble lytic murein transglycosylase
MLPGETLAMIVFRLAAVAAGLTALLVAGLGSDPDRQSPAARVVAALSSTLRPAAPASRPVVAPTVVAARALAPPPRLDLTPVGAIARAAALPTPSPAPAAQPTLGAAPVPSAALTPAAAPATIPAPPLEAAAPSPRLDGAPLAAAAALFRKGDLAGGDALASKASDASERVAFDWLALRLAPRPDDKRLAAFAAAHPQWPGGDWLRAVAEGRLYADHPSAETVTARFAGDPPRTPAGKLALARALLDSGRRDEATAIVAPLWRNDDLDAWSEAETLKTFAALLTRADHKYRADRLLYAEKSGAALRAAALAGPDEVALAEARIAAANGPLTPRAVAAVPPALQKDPGLLFARVQDARRANRAREAAGWLALAPIDAAALIDPDKWWSEQRMVARELIDIGEPRQAFALCAAAAPASAPAKVDAAFHAGWIALRFLGEAEEAAKRFDVAVSVAATPLSIARAGYWRGRAAEALGRGDEARRFYERAAAFPIAYYGQLAAERLGRGALALRAPAAVAAPDARDKATRVVAWLYAAGLDDLANALAQAAAGQWSDESQLAALADGVSTHGDAAASVAFGKIVTERGFALDASAFPISGVPQFAPLAGSADLPSVYAVARQESEFARQAASSMGAKGLMQILPSTAQEAARRAGVPFNSARLVGDPAFNVQLGAAYLGQMIADQGGSVALALAAYNAGAGRVAQWIAAYGDPRAGKADPVDWVERIPFDETRDYVERVSENIGVYRARFAAAQAASEQTADR